MFSDGYVDQFEALRAKSSNTAASVFFSLISIACLAEQKQMLEITFDNWKGENDQWMMFFL
jgi:hypothetical protein